MKESRESRLWFELAREVRVSEGSSYGESTVISVPGSGAISRSFWSSPSKENLLFFLSIYDLDLPLLHQKLFLRTGHLKTLSWKKVNKET